MAVTYGATGDSRVTRALGQGSSFEIDEEYDYLPLPDVDENYIDPTDGTDGDQPSKREVFRRRPFSDIHQPAISFDSHFRQCFLPGQKIEVKIIKVEHSDQSSHMVNPNLYVIQVTHGDYEWVVHRRYKHFRSLHDSLILYRTRAMLPVVTKEARFRKKSFIKTNHQVIQKFPKRPEVLVRAENLDERKEQLEAYLQSVLRCSPYRNHPDTLEFLDVCRLSFVSGLGKKLKEGMVDKQAGGRRISLNCCTCCFYCQPRHFQQRFNT